MAGRRDPADEPTVSSDTPLEMAGGGGVSNVRAPCPVCDSQEATLRTIALDVPYFGEVFESVFLCGACGFRHADTLLPRIQEPTEFSILVAGEDDLFVRAVKSSSATVAVPELGLLWEPGPASVALVTNVEGLLLHFEDAIERAKVLFPEEGAQARAQALTAQLGAIKEGRASATVVIRDPYGNSALLGTSPRVSRRTLGDEEAAQLATGEYILEASPSGRPDHLRRAAPDTQG